MSNLGLIEAVRSRVEVLIAEDQSLFLVYKRVKPTLIYHVYIYVNQGVSIETSFPTTGRFTGSRWKNLILNGCTDEYFYNTIRTIKSVTPEQLRELAQQYLQEEDFYELVVV